MTYLTDTQVEKACTTLRKAIEAAENSNHAGEVFVVAAAAAMKMKEALESAQQWSEEERRWAETPDLAKWIDRDDALTAALAAAEGRAA